MHIHTCIHVYIFSLNMCVCVCVFWVMKHLFLTMSCGQKGRNVCKSYLSEGSCCCCWFFWTSWGKDTDLRTVSFKVWLSDHFYRNHLMLNSTQNLLIKHSGIEDLHVNPVLQLILLCPDFGIRCTRDHLYNLRGGI